MSRLPPRKLSGMATARGFSLVEVLVAFVIIGVGMLGLAKIQALAYASTGTASMRSLAALEASSMASAMHANRNYWATTPTTFSFTGSATPTTTGPTLGGDPTLTGTVCSTACSSGTLAAYDVQTWAKNVGGAPGVGLPVLPNSTGTIVCATSASGPIGCTISLAWSESNVAINSQAAGNLMTTKPYTLYVVP